MAKKKLQSDELLERLADLFMRLRKKGYTQQKIALKLGVSQGQVSKLMNGLHMPSASLWLELTKIAGTKAEY